MQEEADDEIGIMNLQLSGGGGNRLDEVFMETTRWDEDVDTDRHIAEKDRRELPFDGDKENGPPFGWVLLWGGT
ncbi:hypothetical protein CSAL01_12108 [Colletotrichum salicis]|uniref:Uncharacterized protein n=1 Tax=Colletotrichum salicis TaxID=1209931 RepID=A0A135TXX2_9PEZI|nr:hypothetical protein CSAL01_12108 [Colletotrichum salicis]